MPLRTANEHPDTPVGANSAGPRLPLSYWGFNSGSRGLELSGLAIAAVAEEVGTPFYLFDEGRLRRNIQAARDTAAQSLVGAELHYSFKTNPVPRVLEIVREEGLGAEVISGREFRAALTAGFPGRRIVFNGPGKRDADLVLALEHGSLVQVESESEARALARLASSMGRTARAGLRLNPDTYDDRAHASVRMGSRSTVFGLDPTGTEFARAVDILTSSPSVQLESLSASIGTGIIDPEPFSRAALVLAETRRRFIARGIRVSTIDVGGGFAVPSEVRYPSAALDAIEAGHAVPVPAPGDVAAFSDICQAIAGAIGSHAPERCILEPGRLLVADAFHLIARVTRLKGDAHQRFAVLDAGRAQNGLFVARGYHEFLAVAAPEVAPTTCYTIVGPLCAAFDTFARSRALPELAEGDLIAILDVGAYNVSAQSNWSFDPAPVIALRDGAAVRTPTLS